MSRATWIIAFVIIGGSFAASAYFYPQLPERVPIHWNWKGEIDGYGSKATGLFLTPAMLVVMVLVLAAVPYLSPEKFKIDPFRSTYQTIVVIVMCLFAYIHGVLLLAMRYPNSFDSARVLTSGLFLFFAAMGNFLGKIRRNFYVGIRVPWTLADDRVWDATHRLGGWLFVAAGLLGFVFSLCKLWYVGMALLLIAIIVTIVYSFIYSKKLERLGSGESEGRAASV